MGLFLQQHWPPSEPREIEEEIENHLALSTAARWEVLTVGNFAFFALLDNNRFAHDPRTDFLN